jgi:4-amino-4-deoxy-L-arabinose transferase-like glycosyltransferase
MPLFPSTKKVFEGRKVQTLFLFLLFSAPILFTLPDYGITYDEPIYMEASRSIRQWLSLDLRNMFSQEAIEEYWKTDPLRNVHPSGVKWLYIIAQGTVFWEKDPYIQNRLFFIFVFAGSLALFLQWNFGPSLARSALTVLLLLSTPRFFAHSHFAATDMPMTAFLMLFILAESKSADQGNPWLAGILLGFLVSIKVTSVLLALPLLALFLILHRTPGKKALRTATLLGLTAGFTFYVLNPDWWFSPLSRSVEFISQTMTRKDWTPITVYFGGAFYPYRGPFTYPFVMFFITTPLLHVLLLVLGLEGFFHQKKLTTDRRIITGLVGFFTPFILLALPLSPTNDGIRYLLPALPFAVCLMTGGSVRLWNFVVRSPGKSPATIALRLGLAAACLALFALDIHNPARQPPYELSYYNSAVGGLSGAHQRGYETTYWWEILNDSALQKLDSLTSGSRVYFPVLPTDLFFVHMTETGKIRFSPTVEPLDAEFMLIFGRPYVKFWEERTFSVLKQDGKTAVPIWDITLDSVPLLRLYRIRGVGGTSTSGKSHP